jgi:serine/threonine protein kinase
VQPVTTREVERIRRLFDAASERDPSDGKEFLSRSGEDPELISLIEQMLEADRASHSILDRPLGLELGLDREDPGLKEGDYVGPYRILRKIGDGGMGVVYLSERDSQLFAVKTMLQPLPGFSDRFLQERAILTRLHHPNIASYIDSGQTDDKTLYLVMEYVDGVPIHQYCADRNLSTKQRVEVFRQVCAAVNYLHQNLVVHRDLKPGNILVTTDGRAKLVDFGIAKLLPAPTSPTHTLSGAMTPCYASPEQIRDGSVSTLTDVFTLGILLYELLTGANPFADGATGIHETLRRICEEEPARPSGVPGHSDLRGELDNIVLKAIQKQPGQRYASVEQFDADLHRFLLGLPVLAQRGSSWYLASKFIKRYRASVGVTVLVFLSLCGGIIGTSLQARVARRERARAQVQAQAAEVAQKAAEQERNRAEFEKARAETQTAAAERQKLNAERRLAELQKVVQNAVTVYRSADRDVPAGTKALMAENVRDSLLALERESTLDPALASMLALSSAEVRSFQVADKNAASKLPLGWSASASYRDDYRVGVDRQYLLQGKPSLFLTSLVPNPRGQISVRQQFSAEKYRGKRVRLSGSLQPIGVEHAYISLLMISGATTERARGANVSGTNSWKKYDIVMDVPDTADSIGIVVGLAGAGTLWTANLTFDVVGPQVPLTEGPRPPLNPQNLNFRAK